MGLMDSSNVCPPSLDNTFGPAVDSCRRNFDFTLLFEEVILLITPSVVFLFLALLRIVVLSRRRQDREQRKARKEDVLQCVKIVSQSK